MVGRQDAIDAFLATEPRWHRVADDPGGATTLEGPAIVLGPTDKEYAFDLRLEVPRSFPKLDADPVAVILRSPMKLGSSDAHIGGSGALCLQMPPAHEIDYEREGLVGFFQQVVIHLRRAVIHALVGEYPGPVYAHGDDGKKEFRDELVARFPVGLRRFVQPGLGLPSDNQWCPCGERKRFRQCHKEQLKAARSAYLAAGGRPRASVRDRLKRK